MEFEIRWHDDTQRIMWYIVPEVWTIEKYIDAVRRGREIISQTAHTVCVVIDLRQNRTGMVALIHELPMNVLRTRPSNSGIGVYLSGNYVVRSHFDTFQRIYPDVAHLYRMAETEEQALQYIEDWFAQQNTDHEDA